MASDFGRGHDGATPGRSGGPRSPSRDPEVYEETDHFEDAFEDGMRFVERSMVPEVIEEGRDYPEQGGRGKVRRKKEYGGVDAVLVMALDSRVLVTTWTEVRSWKRAMASDRWSMEDLETMRAFMDGEHKRRP
jgi:hypothetical protein